MAARKRVTLLVVIFSSLLMIQSSFTNLIENEQVSNFKNYEADAMGFEWSVQLLNASDGGPVENCSLGLKDGWSGIVIESSTTSESGYWLFTGIFEVSIIPIIECESLIPKDSIQVIVPIKGQVHTIEMIEVVPESLVIFSESYENISWWSWNPVISIKSSLDQIGFAKLSLPSGISGWILAESPESKILIPASSSGNVTLSVTGNHNLSAHLSDTLHGTFSATHILSGYKENISILNGIVNHTLPKIDCSNLLSSDCGWLLTQQNGSKIFISDSNNSNLSNQLSGWFDPQPEILDLNGSAELNFSQSLEVGSNVSVMWNATHRLFLSWGISLMPNPTLGIDGQIDKFLGDNDGILTISEWDIFVTWFSIQAWNNGKSAGCCILDNTNMMVQGDSINPSDIYLSIFGNLPTMVGNISGSWGWSESAQFQGQRNWIPRAVLDLPFANDGRQTSDLNIILNDSWEFRSSPREEWISGNPDNFVVKRDNTGVFGNLPIVLAKNEKPNVVAKITGPGNSEVLDYDLEFILDAHSSTDNSLGFLNCDWKLNTSGVEIFFEGKEVQFNASTFIEIFPKDNLTITLKCIDYHGSQGEWINTFVLDHDIPIINNVTAVSGCLENDINIMLRQIVNCEIITVLSGERVQFEVYANDSTSSVAGVFWSSNKSHNWNNDGEKISLTFYQGMQTNNLEMPVEERHHSRSESWYILDLEIVDSVGHNITKSWKVQVLDNTPPTIKSIVWIEGKGSLSGSQIAMPNDVLHLDLNNSFDDISSIENLTWWIDLDGEPIIELQGVGWIDVRNVSLPNLNPGLHQIYISAIDQRGNLKHNYSHEILIHPPDSLELEILEIKWPSSQEPGKVEVQLVLQNRGSGEGILWICMLSHCHEVLAPVGNISGPGIYNAILEWDVDTSDYLKLSVNWTDSAGQSHLEIFDSGIKVKQDRSSIETLMIYLLVVATIGICFILIGRK